MRRSDPARESNRCPDWRGWIILAWVAWFSLLYGRMVVERRGGKLQGMLTRVSGSHRDLRR